MRIIDWSSDVCSSYLDELHRLDRRDVQRIAERLGDGHRAVVRSAVIAVFVQTAVDALAQLGIVDRGVGAPATLQRLCIEQRLERRTRLARRLHRIDAETMRMRVIGARAGAHAIAVEIDYQHSTLSRPAACQTASIGRTQ